MDLAKSWATAVAVYLTGTIVTAFTAVSSGSTPEELNSTGGAIIWNAVPSVTIYLIMAALSAVVHSSPRRERPARHAVAVLLVPALLVIAGLVFGLFQGSPPLGLIAGAVGATAGTVAGWWAGDRLRGRGRSSQASTNGYF